MLPCTKLSEAAEIAERLRSQVEQADLETILNFFEMVTGLPENKDALRTTVSVGVAELDSTCSSIDVLVDHADRAMYLAKKEGRNRVMAWPKSE